jgi:hypothetical protein
LYSQPHANTLEIFNIQKINIKIKKLLYKILFINYFLLITFKAQTKTFQKILYHFFAKDFHSLIALFHSTLTFSFISFHFSVFDKPIIEATAHQIINQVINLSIFFTWLPTSFFLKNTFFLLNYISILSIFIL